MSMTYKGYTGTIEYSAPDRVFHGRIAGITDVITFEGTSVDELEADFRAGVDRYLLGCAEDGVEPQRPFSGKFVLRLTPEDHRDVSVAARRERASMNAWIVQAIRMRLQAEGRVAHEGAEERLSEAAGG
jgi:predicted HicB family RNase H-like nuclease